MADKKTEMERQFIAAAQAVGCTVELCADAQELQRCLSGTALPLVLADDVVADWPHLTQQLRGNGATLAESAEVAAAAVAGITTAQAALALTGTVVVASSDESVRWASTLPQEHIVIVRRGDICASQSAVTGKLRTMLTAPGAYVAYITGPSRTADIERVLTIGVHGPRRVRILLIPASMAEVSHG